MNKNQVAITIIEQLGGNKFLAMTGAKKLTAYETGLGFKIGRNKSKANWVHIELNHLDLYDVKFCRVDVRTGFRTLNAYKGIYFDQLQEIFTDYTGLDTHL